MARAFDVDRMDVIAVSFLDRLADLLYHRAVEVHAVH